MYILQVSIEYGLCEIIGPAAIPAYTRPKDGKWFPDIAELEAVLPAGTIDHSAGRIYESLPQWEESIEQAGRRYEEIFVALADKFPNENLLLVTHGTYFSLLKTNVSRVDTGYWIEITVCIKIRNDRKSERINDNNNLHHEFYFSDDTFILNLLDDN